MKRIILLLLTISPYLSIAQPALPGEVVEEIKNRIEIGVNPSIAVGIVNDKGVAFYTYGTTKAGGPEINEHTIYEIGSISKAFTGILLAKAIEEGKVKIDDPAQKYLTGATLPTRNGKEITLGHLTDHTSALPRMPDNFSPADPLNPYADYTSEDLLEFLNSLSGLSRDIGSQYEYSNLAQGLLGHILSEVYGSSYEELMRTKIAGPLKLDDTRVTFTESMQNRLALPHSEGVVVKNWDIPALAGAGAIRSSPADMIKFLQANMGLKKSKLYSAMKASHTERHSKAGSSRVGYGWHINKGDKGDIIWHNGGTGGYRAFAGFVNETKTGVVVLTNSTASADDIGMKLLNPGATLVNVKPNVVSVLKKEIESNGIEAAIKAFNNVKESKSPAYEITEAPINTLGYTYIDSNLKVALALFELNMREFPNSSNVYDSYAEALLKDGKKELAIENYKKSIELNPGNDNAKQVLRDLGVELDDEIEVSEKTLESYVGNYQLAPTFFIEITRDGNQLFGQATGQPRFELFPKSDTDFYLKVVEAQIKFTVENGEVKSLTLYQGGQVMPGTKVK